MQRIAVIGSPGAGKSTLSRRLGEILSLPVYHLDALYWKPGWKETPRNEWRALQEEILRGDRWLIDGNYGSSFDIRLPAADTIIYLDLPRWLCLWGAVRRRFQYAGRQRPDMGQGCPEQVDLEFLKWIWSFPVKERPKVQAWLDRLEIDKRVIRLRSRREMMVFLAQVTLDRHIP